LRKIYTMNIMSTQTLTLTRPQRQTLVASRNASPSVVTLPVAPGVIFTQLPLEAFVPIPGLEPRIEELIEEARAYERKQRANAVNRRMSRKMGGASASAAGANDLDADELHQAASELLLTTGSNLSRASTTATVDAVIAYLTQIREEKFAPVPVPAPPAGPEPPHVAASDKAGTALFATYSVAFMANYSAIEQNKVIAAGREHIVALITALNELKAAVRANANGAPGQDVNRRIKAACTVALVGVNKERANANRGELVSNMARHLAAFLPSKTDALRAAATLLAPTAGSGGASGAPTPAPVGSLSGALLASAAAGHSVAAFAPAPVVGPGGAVDHRVPVTFSKDAVPTTALGAVAEYLPTAAWGLGLPTLSMVGSYVVSQAPCYVPAFASYCGAPLGVLNYAKVVAVGLSLATGRSALGKVYGNDRLYVRSAAEYVGGVWSDCQRNRAAASAAASARQILEAHVALIKAAQGIETNLQGSLLQARQAEFPETNVQTFVAANRTAMERYKTSAAVALKLPGDKQEAAVDRALRQLVDFRVAEVKKLQARVAALVKQKTADQARVEAAIQAELEATLRAPPAGAPNGLRQRTAAAPPPPPPPRPTFTPGGLSVPPPVRPPRAKTPVRGALPPLPGFAAAPPPPPVPLAPAPLAPAPLAPAPLAPAPLAPAPNAAGGGPALAAAVVVVDLSSLVNKPEYRMLAAQLPEPQARALLDKINEMSWAHADKAATLDVIRAFINTLAVSVNARNVRSAHQRNEKAAKAALRARGLEGGGRTRRKRRTIRNRR
jgi:hypothetical protein